MKMAQQLDISEMGTDKKRRGVPGNMGGKNHRYIYWALGEAVIIEGTKGVKKTYK